MDLKNISSINEALDLNYKAILTLYTYAEQQKIITTDISGTLNEIIADAIINKNTVERLVNVVDRLVLINWGMTEISKERTGMNDSMINVAEKHERQIKIIVEEFDKMIVSRRYEKIGYCCDFIIIICAITAVYFFK